MPVQFTTRRKNRYPQSGDQPIVHADIQHLAEDLDDAPTYDQGVILSRPTSTAPSPGEVGRWYRSTNQGPGNQGLLYLDNGTGWDNVAKFAQIADTYANRPAAGADLNGLRFWATDKWMEWMCIASAWVLLRAEAQPVSALPGSPVDGQRISLALDTTTRHVLRYNNGSGSPYKWESEGGSRLINSSTTASVGTGAFTLPSTSDTPPITVPFAGDWDYIFGYGVLSPPVAGVLYQYGLAVGAAAPVAPHIMNYQGEAGGYPSGGSAASDRLLAVAAATIIKAKISTSNGNPSYANQHIALWPHRLG